MSRGFRASETELQKPRLGQQGLKQHPKVVNGAVEELQTNFVARETLGDLIDAVNYHQRTVPGTKVENPKAEERAATKQNKLKIVELVKQLPSEVRKAIEMPRSMIDKLYRGVRDRQIEEKGGWENGKFVYGFTPDKEIALQFTDDPQADYPTLVTSSDIESFGGIFSVSRLYAVVEAFNRRLWGDDKTFNPKFFEPTTDGWRGADDKKRAEYAQNSFTVKQNEYENEKEYFVYDIKFKKFGNDFFAF